MNKTLVNKIRDEVHILNAKKYEHEVFNSS